MTDERTWRKDYRFDCQANHPNLDTEIQRQASDTPPTVANHSILNRTRWMDACDLLEDAQAEIEALRAALREIHAIHSTIEVGPATLTNIGKLMAADKLIWDALHEIPKEEQIT